MQKLLNILKDFYAVEITHGPSYLTIMGVIASTENVKIRRSYGHLANAANRTKINKLAQDHKLVAIDALENRLKMVTEQVAKEGKASEPADYCESM